jgi:hypothetical protein
MNRQQLGRREAYRQRQRRVAERSLDRKGESARKDLNLVVELDGARADDRKFFERYFWRTYRVRFCSPAEIEVLKQSGRNAPPGYAWLLALKKLASDVRMHVYLQGSVDAEPELLDEQQCAELFTTSAGPYRQAIEAGMRAAIERRGWQ